MKTLFIIFLVLIQSGFILAQTTFEKVYQLDISPYKLGKQVQQTSDGGFMVSGITYTSEESSPFLFKTDANGDSLWFKNYDAMILPENEFKAIETPDGGFLCGPSYGDYYITDFGHFYLMKTDSEGNQQWEEIFEASVHDQGTDFIISSDNMVIMCGFTFDLNAEMDMVLLVTDLHGSTYGKYIYVHPEAYFPAKILELSSGGFMIAGYTYEGEKLFVQKLDSSYNEEWIKTYSLGDETYSIGALQSMPDGTVSMVSTVYDWESDKFEHFIMKLDGNGELLETNKIDFTSFPFMSSAVMSDENHFVVTGWIEGYMNFSESVFLSKVTTTGEVVWERYFNATNSNLGITLSMTDDNGYIINGTVYNEGYFEQLYLIKTDEQGMISGIGDQQADASPYRIFPNPVTDQLNVELENNIKASEYTIYNIQGQLISTNILDSKSISVANLTNGIYFIELSTNEGIVRQKFIK